MKKEKLYSPYKYADLCGVSTQAIYQRIRLGTLITVSIPDASGKKKNYIDISKYPPNRKKK
jgi:hypothetical protein